MKRVLVLAVSVAGTAHAGDQAVLHRDPSPEIIVTAPYLRDRADQLSGVSVLQGTRLQTEIRPTIGETLQRLPGVSATSFGPNASRPILRGLEGERVRVLTDGVGTIDVSNTSVDHAVAINPLLADRIEVLRGPASLQFGSSAIGGVVNVTDRRIAREVPAEALHLDALGTLGSAARERSASAAIDLPLGDKLVFHADGSYLKTDDLRIGGFVLSPELRAEAVANGVPGLADLRGRLPNTAARTWDAAAGLSVITPTGQAGFAYSRYDSLYGVPIRYSLEPGGEAEAVRLALKQDRLDARAEVRTFGFIDSVRFRLALADYTHAELEEDGEAGTVFTNRGAEARLELVQRETAGWKGASGIQYTLRDFDVVGEEAFVPENETQQLGLFTLQELELGTLRLSAGARYERTTARAVATAGLPDRSFNAYSGSIGGSVALAPDVRLGLNLSHTERAPAAEELFANGPHAGTQAFEIGNPNFAKERADGAEVTLRARTGPLRFEASAYYTRFRNFIVLEPTGEIADDLPVFQQEQVGARFWGFEAEAQLRLARSGETDFNIDGLVDYTRATLLDGADEAAPRIPPLRVLAGAELVSPVFSLRGEVEHVTRQTRIADFETPTRAFTMVNASASFRPFGDDNRTTLVLSANNIFNTEARRHASFLKDYAPLAGRDIRLSLRLSL